MNRKIRKAMLKISKSNPKLRKFMRDTLIEYRRKKYIRLSEKYETDEKMVVFESFMGRGYSDTPKAIYQYMISNPEYDDYKLVWSFRKLERRIDEGRIHQDLERAVLVQQRSDEYFKVYAQAKYWFTNSRLPAEIEPRNDQCFIQCWHGTPLKRLGYDIEQGQNSANSKEELNGKYDEDARRYKYMVSPSAFVTDKYHSAFNTAKNCPDVEIVEQGYPRNDFLFNYKEEDVKRIKAGIGIEESDSRKIVLYAPTWRDNQHTVGKGYTYELAVDFDRWQREIADEFIVLFRPHYFIANSFDFEKYKGFVFDASKIDDINELYVISDLLITDYSSVFFDYANLKRPIVFYMYDLEEYKNNLRDFYISLEELPGEILEREDELIDYIKNMNFSKYDNGTVDRKYKEFNAKYNYLDDGNASKRVIDAIIKK